MSIAKFPTNNNQPLIKGAVSLPVSNVEKSKAIFGGSDDDVDICLNCTLPASKCNGGTDCYRRHKRIKDGGESDGRQ